MAGGFSMPGDSAPNAPGWDGSWSSGASGGTTQSSSGTVGNTAYGVVDPAAGPSFGSQLGPLLDRINSLNPPSYQSLVTQGINSPLLRSILGPALQNLLPGEETGRQNFMDEGRKMGALGSGAMAVGGAKLESGFQNARGNLISQVLSQMLPQITQGLGREFDQQQGISGLLAQVLGLSRPQVVQGSNTNTSSSSSGWNNIPPSLGLGTPMQSDSMGPAGGVQRSGPVSASGVTPGSLLDLSRMDLSGMANNDYLGVGLGPTKESTFNNEQGNAGYGKTFESSYNPYENQVADLSGTGWESQF